MIATRAVLFLFPMLVACGSKWTFTDGDGDGVSAAEGDCWDKDESPPGTDLKGSDIFPGATETWYDGFDQNCAGDDDYDADADGFIRAEHVGLGTEGVEGSGFLPPGDCWDGLDGPGDGSISGADIHPDAGDVWYDGVDQDCGGDDDHDADGDGYVADEHEGQETVPLDGWVALPGGDCVDDPDGIENLYGEMVLGEDINSSGDILEAFYDGVDQDCLGDDDFDQDQDGQRTSMWPDETGTLGPDCFDDEENDELPLEPLLATAIDAEGLGNIEVLMFFGLTAADIYDGADDPHYDGLDQDCGGVGDDCDADGDGFPTDGGGPPLCEDIETDALCAYSVCVAEDCDDLDATVKPDETIGEIYFNGFDDNCDFSDGDGDEDGDGYWASNYADLVPDSIVEAPFGKDGDCNDTDGDIWPGFPFDDPYDGIDADCAGNDDFDKDEDGYVPDEFVGLITEHIPGAGAVSGTGGLPGNDCDDDDSARNPGVNEECGTAYDDDCDSDTNDQDAEECLTWFADSDDDGFGDPADSRCYCAERDEYNEADFDDCDPSSATTFPGAAETESSTACQKDDDGDGYGDNDPPSGVTSGTDCDDTRLLVSPSGTETCATEYDDDCDTDTNDLAASECDNWYADRDGDGFGHLSDVECRCDPQDEYLRSDNTDCDDSSDQAHPGAAETESSTSCRRDEDEDGYGDVSPGAGVVAGDDCDDDNPARNPGVNEDCGTFYDDDCDDDTNDLTATDCTTRFADRDGDLFGHLTDSECRCDAAGDYTTTDRTDCNDGSGTTFPGAAEEESSTSCRKDSDGDGFGANSPPAGVTAGGDCDDSRSAVHPDATETCGTEYDDDCDGDNNDLGASICTEFFTDDDDDGFGDLVDSECRCDPEGVYLLEDNSDCNDDSDTTFPGAAEAESATSCRKDDDSDGYGDVSPASGVTPGTDCDDGRSLVNPGASERCSTGFDDDCDGDTNDLGATSCVTRYNDGDRDGYGVTSDSECRCDASDDYTTTTSGDCDDGHDRTHPGAASSDGIFLCMRDADLDNYGDDGPPAGVTSGTDCDDGRFAVKPSATETCATTYDDDCDGDDNDQNASLCVTFFADVDGDGQGDIGDSACFCEESGVYTEGDTLDCDDTDDDIYFGAPEACDLIDSDCDGSLVDGLFSDDDGDGIPDCVDTDSDGDGYSVPDDCDDSDASIRPGATESCDGEDTDCDGSLVDGFVDTDGDGLPDCIEDEDTDGYFADEDCDDGDFFTNPGISVDDNSDLGVDNDCDEFIDEDYVLDLIAAGTDVVVFTEMMVNPQGGGAGGHEKNNEWFEITNVTDELLFLDNWTFATEDNACSSGSSSCDTFEVYAGIGVEVGPGETALFCFNKATVDAALSAMGIPEECDYKYGSLPGGGSATADNYDAQFRLTNSDPAVLSVALDGEELDSVDYLSTGFPSASDSAHEGQSIALDGVLLSSVGLTSINDVGTQWCHTENEDFIFDESPVSTGEHNLGTPGQVNPSCDDAAP